MLSPSNPKRLIASIHDVSPKFSREIDILCERLSRHLGGLHLAMLVVPNHWGSAPIASDAAFQRRLRDWAESGVEIFVHGWEHRDTSAHSGAMTGLKAKHMTAGEGEFLGLDHAAALARMSQGKALIEDIIGKPTTGFIAPAWLYGPGSLAALSEAGFVMAEDHMKVWHPATGAVFARGPVITWASRSKARIASSLGFAALARHMLRPLATIRIAVHPGDAHVPRLLESIDHSFASLGKGRTISRYADLASDHAATLRRASIN
jgi:uncharacterized protein